MLLATVLVGDALVQLVSVDVRLVLLNIVDAVLEELEELRLYMVSLV